LQLAEVEMLKQMSVAALFAGAVVSMSSHSSAQTFGPNQRCLHGSDEQLADRTRREQAVRIARQINRAENAASLRGPSQPRNYRPLDDPRIATFGIPSAPDGFKLQFYTDSQTYTFSLKDTRDRCGFAIFSDQDGRIYEALPMAANAQVLPADIP
jgi:hypothetical protein